MRNLFVLLRNLSAECVSAPLGSFCSCEIEHGVRFDSTWFFLVPSSNVQTPKFCTNSEAFLAQIFYRKPNCSNRKEVENRGTTMVLYEKRHLGVAKRARTIRAQQKERRTKRAQGKRAQGKRAQSKKGAEQKGRRTKRVQNKKGVRSRCCVSVTFKVVISSDNCVLNLFFFCRNIIHSLRLYCLKYVSIKSLKTEVTTQNYDFAY